MKKRSPLIAIAGHARSGKDTLGNFWVDFLNENKIKAQRFAFADELKKSVDDFLLRELGISAWTTDEDEKKIIRPFLVFWGTDIMRKQNDNVWVERLEGSMLQDGVSVVTDMRFMNELKWVKKQKGFPFMIHRYGVGPANETEQRHGALLEEAIDDQMMLRELDKKTHRKVAFKLLDGLIPPETIKEWKAIYPL